jgi:hypothetical protein
VSVRSFFAVLLAARTIQKLHLHWDHSRESPNSGGFTGSGKILVRKNNTRIFHMFWLALSRIFSTILALIQVGRL